MLEIYPSPLPTREIYQKLDDLAKENAFGANCIFVGTVREENGISALSFDIYEPILISWFKNWEERIAEKGGVLYMAHSLGDVKCGESSFMCAILSSKRRVALESFDIFVEDFKHNAPIWKYDVIKGKRIYAKDRSNPLAHSGLLAK